MRVDPVEEARRVAEAEAERARLAVEAEAAAVEAARVAARAQLLRGGAERFAAEVAALKRLDAEQEAATRARRAAEAAAAEWARHMECDPRPDPRDDSAVNTTLSLWVSQTTDIVAAAEADIEDALAECRDTLSLAAELGRIAERDHICGEAAAGRRRAALQRRIHAAVGAKLNGATADLLQFADRQTRPCEEDLIVKSLDPQLSMLCWANVSRNVRTEDVEFTEAQPEPVLAAPAEEDGEAEEEVGDIPAAAADEAVQEEQGPCPGFTVPPALAVAGIAIRLLHTPHVPTNLAIAAPPASLHDGGLPHSPSPWAPPQAATARLSEDYLIPEPEPEPGPEPERPGTQRARSQMGSARSMRSSSSRQSASKSASKPESAGKAKPTSSAKPRPAPVAEAGEEGGAAVGGEQNAADGGGEAGGNSEDDKRPEPEPIALPGPPPAELVSLQEWRPVGGVWSLSLLALAPPPVIVKKWTIRQLAAEARRDIVPLSYPLPGAPRIVLEGQGEEAIDPFPGLPGWPALRFTLPAPAGVLLPDTLRVAWWDAAAAAWRFDGINSVALDRATGMLSLETLYFAPLTLVVPRAAHHILHDWSLRPVAATAPGAPATVVYALAAGDLAVEVEVRGSECRLLQPAVAGLDDWAHVGNFVPALERAGLGFLACSDPLAAPLLEEAAAATLPVEAGARTEQGSGIGAVSRPPAASAAAAAAAAAATAAAAEGAAATEDTAAAAAAPSAEAEGRDGAVAGVEQETPLTDWEREHVAYQQMGRICSALHVRPSRWNTGALAVDGLRDFVVRTCLPQATAGQDQAIGDQGQAIGGAAVAGPPANAYQNWLWRGKYVYPLAQGEGEATMDVGTLAEGKTECISDALDTSTALLTSTADDTAWAVYVLLAGSRPLTRCNGREAATIAAAEAARLEAERLAAEEQARLEAEQLAAAAEAAAAAAGSRPASQKGLSSGSKPGSRMVSGRKKG